MTQRTIKDSVSVEGIGLQTGRKVRLTIKGAPAGAGIRFIRTDLRGSPSVDIGSLDLGVSVIGFMRRTTIGRGPLQVQTTEHLLAALAGLGVDNALVELDNEELPGLDGSAAGFVDLIRRSGIVSLEAPKRTLEITKAVKCEKDGASLSAVPADGFKVSYTMSYPEPELGDQYFSSVIDEDVFVRQIAPARTFCLASEAEKLLKLGLGKGADLNNTLVIGKDGPIGSKPRFPDEPVRHKVLDLIGDLYLLGMQVKAHIVAVKSGHKLNMELVRKLKSVIT
jgi:UDP-3-O-acyl N-acetylglucosamine deacetylase